MSLTSEGTEFDTPIAEVVSGPMAGKFIFLRGSCCVYHNDRACEEYPCCDHCSPTDGEPFVRLPVGIPGEFRPVIKKFDGLFRNKHMMCGGTSDCGKTKWLIEMAKQYRKAFPHNKIFYFTMSDRPSELEEVVPGAMRISLADMESGEITTAGLAGSLLVLDDVDHAEDVPPGYNVKAIRHNAKTLRDGVLYSGRHDMISGAAGEDENPDNGITMYYAMHEMLDGAKTKAATTQSNIITVFPIRGNTAHANETVLVKKKGLNMQDYKYSMSKMHAPYWIYYDLCDKDVICIAPREVRLLRKKVGTKE